MTSLDLWPTDNCQVSTPDRAGDMVRVCVPSIGGDPFFSSLLGSEEPAQGHVADRPEGLPVRRAILPPAASPVLTTRETDAAAIPSRSSTSARAIGGWAEPAARSRLSGWSGLSQAASGLQCGFGRRKLGGALRTYPGASNHLRFALPALPKRLTTDAPRHVHTCSAAMCWAACDRLANLAGVLGLSDRETLWRARATKMRSRIEQAARPSDRERLSATFARDDLDASLLQLLVDRI